MALEQRLLEVTVLYVATAVLEGGKAAFDSSTERVVESWR